MTPAIRVLIADDEQLFAEATAELLQADGYGCTVVRDAATAWEALAREEFDVVLADVRMPGNEDLGLVREIERQFPGLPVILMTAYPTVATAISSVELPVMSYLLKPLDMPALRKRLAAAAALRRTRSGVERMRLRLAAWDRELQDLDGPQAGVAELTRVAARHLADTLGDLRVTPGGPPSDPCALVPCERRGELERAVRETVRVLGETRRQFHSRELGELRHRLEQVLGRSEP